MADTSTAPLWLWPPSWGDGAYTETFSFLTSMMIDQQRGTEQRQALRVTPRKLVEATYAVLDSERTQFDLAVQAVGAQKWRFPLWHYGILVQGLQAGDFSVDYDFRGRDIVPGQQMVIIGAHIDEYEIVTCDGLDENGHARLHANIVNDWPNCSVIPLREAYLTDQPQPLRSNGYVTTVQARFQLAGPNQYTPAPPTITYRGLPVITGRGEDQTNGVQGGYQRFVFQLDNGTGAIYRVDTAGRSNTLQSHTVTVQGAFSYNRVRDFIYTMRGMLNLAWLPTFADDFKLVQPVAANANTLVVQYVGYSLYGIGNPNRQFVFIELNNGDRYFGQITGAVTSDGGKTETIAIDYNIPEAFDPIDVYQISFMTQARLTTDDIELTLVAGIDGVTIAPFAFQSAPDLRAVA